MSMLQRVIGLIMVVLLVPAVAAVAGAAGPDPGTAPGERLRLLVLPCEAAAGGAELALVADDLLVQAILEQKRFRVVEKEKLQQVLQEQQLSRQKLTTPEHSLRLGRLATAEAILSTRFTAAEKSLRLTARLIMTETGATIDTITLQAAPGRAGVRQLASQLASALASTLPLLTGEVVQLDGATATVNFPGSGQLPRGMKLLFYRRGKELRHPVTGRALGVDLTILGEVPIMASSRGAAVVRLSEQLRRSELRPGDLAVTK